MQELNWDLSLIYKNEDEINKDIEKVEKLLLESEKVQKEEKFDIEKNIEYVEKISIILSRLIAYSNMKRDENSKLDKSQKLVLEVEALAAKVSEVFSAIEPAIMKKSESEIEEFMQNCSRKDYILYVKKMLRHKKHILSEKEEYILSVASDISNDTENSYYMLSYADMKFPVIENDREKRELTHANYINFQNDSNRDVRKEAFEKMHGTYKNYINTFAANYYGHVKAVEKLAKLRKFDSNLNEELFSDDVNPAIYDNLIEAVSEYIPYMSEYMDIKKKYLNVDGIHNYDLYANLFDKDERKYSYDEAKEIIINALSPLGDEYISILKKGFEDRWIDVYPRDGKKSGAYSFGAYDTNPYILTNYTDNLNSVFTLAHELGHSIHSYYSRKNNPYLSSDYTIFVAEVASTTNELLLYDYMLKNAEDEKLRKNLIIYNLEQFRTTVFRQTMFAEFEKLAHGEVLQSRALTAESLSKIYLDLNKKYYPNINVDELIAYEWARIPHFYSDFYVYKYATGFSCASFLSQSILKGGENVKRYIDFLKDGGKNFPVQQLKLAGVDIGKKQTISQALDLFKESVRAFK